MSTQCDCLRVVHFFQCMVFIFFPHDGPNISLALVKTDVNGVQLMFLQCEFHVDLDLVSTQMTILLDHFTQIVYHSKSHLPTLVSTPLECFRWNFNGNCQGMTSEGLAGRDFLSFFCSEVRIHQTAAVERETDETDWVKTLREKAQNKTKKKPTGGNKLESWGKAKKNTCSKSFV